MRILLSVTAVFGLALGLLWPTPGDGTASTPGAGEVVLQRSSDGHFYAQARVDGKPVRFLVDTGSSAVALTPDDARELGIEVDRREFAMIGHGASGLVRGKYVDVQEIELGEIRQKDVEVAVVEGGSVSLLGQPFLQELDEIVIRKDEMLLRASSRP